MVCCDCCGGHDCRWCSVPVIRYGIPRRWRCERCHAERRAFREPSLGLVMPVMEGGEWRYPMPPWGVPA
jgi:hypothetical protein